MEIREMEAKAIPYLISGKTVTDTAKLIDSTVPKLKYIITKLVRIGVLNRTSPGKYELGITSYTIMEDEPPPRPTVTVIKSLSGPAMPIPADTAQFIKAHYGQLPRSEIAKRLGLDKLTLNLMILQMRLKGSG